MPFGASKWTQNVAKREDKSRFFNEVVNKASQLSPYKSYLFVIMIKRSKCLIHQQAKWHTVGAYSEICRSQNTLLEVIGDLDLMIYGAQIKFVVLQ